MRHRRRDFQRARVYRFEQSQWWWALNEMGAVSGVGPEEFRGLSLGQCAELVAKLTGRDCGFGRSRLGPGRRIVVEDGRRSSRGWVRYGLSADYLVLPTRARTIPYLCHEAAHLLTRGDGHGPGFMAAYCDLLERAGVTTAGSTRRAAIDFGLMVGPLVRFIA